jgi:biotin operon repressor
MLHISYKENNIMLKPQDCIVLIKLLANPSVELSQRQLAKTLCISLSEVNAGIKRLEEAGLLRKDKQGKLFPNINAAEDFLINAVKFFFPVKLGEYTRGVPTAIAAPIFHNKIAFGNDPIPVWPDASGEKRGVALEPLHPSVPRALRESPDQLFYELLVLVDTIRLGRPRERNLAANLLKERLNNARK